MAGETTRPAGFRWLHHASVVSTNDLVLAAARAGEPAGLWVTAERQTGGRGRGGRAWASEPGNFYGSRLYRTDRPLTELSLLPLAAALGVRDAVAELLAGAPPRTGDRRAKAPSPCPSPRRRGEGTQTAYAALLALPHGERANESRRLDPSERGEGTQTAYAAPLPLPHGERESEARRAERGEGASSPALTLKWPNDVLIAGAKAAGILLESERAGDGTLAVAIGCGINVAHHPAETAFPATHLVAHGAAASTVEAILEGLARTMAGALRLFEEAPQEVRRRWLAAAHGLGRPLIVRLPSQSLHGTFAGLDEGGRLLLDCGERRRAIATGDLFFGAPASSGEATA